MPEKMEGIFQVPGQIEALLHQITPEMIAKVKSILAAIDTQKIRDVMDAIVVDEQQIGFHLSLKKKQP